jgi:hypothetical protein
MFQRKIVRNNKAIYSRLITYGSSGLRRQTAGGPTATSVPAVMSLLGLSGIFSFN